jgi:hypothetical protein
VTLPQSEITGVDIVRSLRFSESIEFAATHVPPGVSVRFDPPGATPGVTRPLVLVAGPTAALGTWAITLVATASGGWPAAPAWTSKSPLA